MGPIFGRNFFDLPAERADVIERPGERGRSFVEVDEWDRVGKSNFVCREWRKLVIEVDVEIRNCVLAARRFSRRLGRIPRKRRRGNWRARSTCRPNGRDGFGTSIYAPLAALY